MAEGKLVPFGKYKDQPVEVLAQDKGYVEPRSGGFGISSLGLYGDY